jgi:Xaa-Pro dipeptidase
MVPREEIESRTAAFQGALRSEGLDGALIVQDVDLFYLSGTAQNAHLVMPAEGEPALFVRKSLSRAREETPLDRVDPLRSLGDLPAALASCGVGGGRLGLELDVLPAALFLQYQRRLDGSELVDCSRLLRAVRARKSPWELEQIRPAAAMLSRIDRWMAEILREGMTEIELAAEIERLLRREGHQGIVHFRGFNQEMFYGSVLAGPSAAIPGASETPIVGPGPNAAISKGASQRPIGRGEPIIIDLCGAWEGYLADQTRTFSLGPVDAKFREAYEGARGILHTVAAESRPGVTPSALYERSVELAGDREGFMGAEDERVSFVGHGFGLEIDELPVLMPGADEPLAEGMVFALEPKFIYPGEGAVGIENSYAVTADGVEQLTTAPEELIEL